MTRLPVLILRPEPGAAATLTAARAMGLVAQAFPLFEVRAVSWDPVPREDVDALLLGSANALRHGGKALATYHGLPVYAVGETTAEAAREAGLDVAATGRGGLQNMLEALEPTHRRLLRLAGRERVELAVPRGVEVVTREVYASEPLPLPTALIDLLASPSLVLLHSGEAAAHFAQSCEQAGIDRALVRLAAIGPRVEARAGTGWADLRSAPTPDDAALLALALRMCQEAGSGQ
ncbi:uroporphyrinogen-III synthase [Novosphingobium sp. AP12]|uniref:uroporphyrinogen-III synthase n=1 Tax=Novosphingobium sp. AP12 TaxID=1144305 RepID=UPI000271D90E|nr:uroporphyrinogen-III synthase [Novosphingobium sp. AP12]EJL24859.1 uroporphyrinogen-III synthase [Novosphingobium sp. AP12]